MTTDMRMRKCGLLVDKLPGKDLMAIPKLSAPEKLELEVKGFVESYSKYRGDLVDLARIAYTTTYHALNALPTEDEVYKTYSKHLSFSTLYRQKIVPRRAGLLPAKLKDYYADLLARYVLEQNWDLLGNIFSSDEIEGGYNKEQRGGREIVAQEVMGFSQEYPSENFYNIDIGELPFGFLYISPATWTLGWQGTFNFTSLDSEALERLPSYIEPGWAPTSTQDSMIVYLILQARELTVYDLRQEDQKNQYRDIVDNPEMIDKISFVRYDVQHTTTSSTLQYSFTAENPRERPATGNELTILLPRSQPWSSKLLEWVIEHHKDASFLQERLDPLALSTIISSLPGS